MDEHEYRQAYQEVNTTPCVFERAILRRCGICELAQRLNLAEREAVKCLSEPANKLCRQFLAIVHEKAAFAVGEQIPGEKLPFGKEIKIQCGSIVGLINSLDKSSEALGIHTLIEAAREATGDINILPFENIIRDISAFQSRRKRK